MVDRALASGGNALSGQPVCCLNDATEAVRVVERSWRSVISDDRRQHVELGRWITAAKHVQRIAAIGLAVARDPFLDVGGEVQDPVGARSARKRIDRDGPTVMAFVIELVLIDTCWIR